MTSLKSVIVFPLLLVLFVSSVYSDKACAARQISGRSVVCVCNTTYCDEITRETPASGGYIAYTSSKAGSRFRKTSGILETYKTDLFKTLLTLETSKRYQYIEGFGGAVTDSAAINWKNLTDSNLMQYFVDSYFSSTGIEYNIVRIPIGGTDFSTHAYAYNEDPAYDVGLTNFNLTYEDYELKIPLLKASIQASTADIHVLGSTWSPPPWMKSNNAYTGSSNLLTEYYKTYALYHLKFIERYTELGVPIWGITTTNEPTVGVIGIVPINSLGWTTNNLGKWIANDLGPMIRNSTFNNTKILCLDDQRLLIPFYVNLMVLENPECLQYIDGVAVHYYTDAIVPPEMFNLITKKYPDKFILATEGCKGSFASADNKVQLGSWDRAVVYIRDILQDLNYNLVGWIDWNMCLNEDGGPNWVGNYVDSPIIVFPENGEFYKQPMFYAMGHFAKFLPRNSRRIAVHQSTSLLLLSSIDNVAFLTPQNTTVVILHNESNKEKTIKIRLSDEQATLTLEANSITTVEFNV